MKNTPGTTDQTLACEIQQVLQLIGALLAPGSRNLYPAETAILNWALGEVIRETNDHPTIRKVIQKIDSPELDTARGGMFEKSMARDLVLMFDVKGDHGVVAEALGGQVFKTDSFGTDVHLNPLQAGGPGSAPFTSGMGMK